jgi:DNA-binding Lrp family transcriptional regulator
MVLDKFAEAVHILAERSLDLTDIYVIAEYHRAKLNGDVTIMALAKSTKLSRTIMHRRIKALVSKGILAKTERGTDMRVKPLVDGPAMAQIVELFNIV